MASHALAVMGAREAIPALEAAIHDAEDWGVRANSAYGLAKLGEACGVEALAAMYESKDADAATKVAIFMGMVDVGSPAFAPAFRKEIENEANEYGVRLMAIMGAGKAKDTEALPLLEHVIDDAAEQDSLKDAAKKAVNDIRGEEVYKIE